MPHAHLLTLSYTALITILVQSALIIDRTCSPGRALPRRAITQPALKIRNQRALLLTRKKFLNSVLAITAEHTYSTNF